MGYFDSWSAFLTYVCALWDRLQSVPGSAIVTRYVKSSYQNDPMRSAVEFVLFLFAVHYLMAPKYSTKQGHVNLSEGEVDDLVGEWIPDPLVVRPSSHDELDILKRVSLISPTGPKSRLSNGRSVFNFASNNVYNYVANEQIKERAIDTLRNYGVGPCGPPGFYGTQDVHMQTESDVAAFLGVSACIIYAQAFSTISSVIPAFSKRGDIIVADKACNYAIRKGLEISRSRVRWYMHNDMADLERVLATVVMEERKKPLTRRFIITEGLFENPGDMTDLPAIIELKVKYKFRLILDETWSFGVLGRNGRGITEHQNVDPTQVDMIVGSLSGAFVAGGGFCAGSEEIVHHQRISSLAYCFSAALPGVLATTASEVIGMLRSSTTLIDKLRDNIQIMKEQLDPRSEWVYCSSVPENPMMLFPIKGRLAELRRLSISDQLAALQSVVDECLVNNVLITRVKPIPPAAAALNADHVVPAIKICMTVGLSRKEIEKAGTTIRHAIAKVFRVRK